MKWDEVIPIGPSVLQKNGVFISVLFMVPWFRITQHRCFFTVSFSEVVFLRFGNALLA
jgi:hypothetical protein